MKSRCPNMVVTFCGLQPVLSTRLVDIAQDLANVVFHSERYREEKHKSGGIAGTERFLSVSAAEWFSGAGFMFKPNNQFIRLFIVSGLPGGWTANEKVFSPKDVKAVRQMFEAGASAQVAQLSNNCGIHSFFLRDQGAASLASPCSVALRPLIWAFPGQGLNKQIHSSLC